MRQIQQGFTLIELMIVVAIIGILAAVAIPNYQIYTKKAKFSEVMRAVSPIKVSVEGCFLQQEDLANCGTPGANGVQPNLGASGYVSAVTTGANGVITATGATTVDSRTFILTPGTSGTGNLTWAKSGTCMTAGLC